MTVAGHALRVRASIGIALAPVESTDPDDVLRKADLALYAAKGNGKSRFAVFDSSMERNALERLELETALRLGLERGEFRVLYQPIVSLASGQIVEVEALVRWEHPQRGLIPPAAFIPVAEETGLIVPLGQLVLEAACRQARQWQTQYPSAHALSVAVNLSARQFQHPRLVADIDRALREAGLASQLLKLEITESVAMQDADSTARTLDRLKVLGIKVAIDDFGTGYSSLSYLKRFPVDALKIDRSFVDGLGEDSQDTAIVQSIVALAKSLGVGVTGEGVETATQASELRALGCDRGQGYLFSKPVPAVALGDLLARAEAPSLASLAA
jgi:EAL domain-containing protein (putative c-di-GMP-specific phosphodiesterase class I)